MIHQCGYLGNQLYSTLLNVIGKLGKLHPSPHHPASLHPTHHLQVPCPRPSLWGQRLLFVHTWSTEFWFLVGITRRQKKNIDVLYISNLKMQVHGLLLDLLLIWWEILMLQLNIIIMPFHLILMIQPPRCVNQPLSIPASSAWCSCLPGFSQPQSILVTCKS